MVNRASFDSPNSLKDLSLERKSKVATKRPTSGIMDYSLHVDRSQRLSKFVVEVI